MGDGPTVGKHSSHPPLLGRLGVRCTRVGYGEGDLVAAPEPLPPAQTAEMRQLHPDHRDRDDLDLLRAERDGGKARDGGLTERHGGRKRQSVAKARTGKVPNPATFGGTAEKRNPGIGQLAEMAQVLDDRDLGREQRRVHRPLEIA